jgi:hypothetical protein
LFFHGEEMIALYPSPCQRTTPCRLFATVYSVSSQLISTTGNRLLSPQPEDAPDSGNADPLNIVYENSDVMRENLLHYELKYGPIIRCRETQGYLEFVYRSHRRRWKALELIPTMWCPYGCTLITGKGRVSTENTALRGSLSECTELTTGFSILNICVNLFY